MSNLANESTVDTVREQYGNIAKTGNCCSPVATVVSLELGYQQEELGQIPEGADLGLGCGAPLADLALAPGEVVLDLGSGPGLDALIAAGAVGEAGQVIGVDMTPEMLALARDNAAKAGMSNVEFRAGRLEELPVADDSIDAVTSNCVINLVPDKAQVFREVARVLKPGGRLVVSDIVLDGRLPESIEKDVYAWVGCVSGAAMREDYFGWLSDAGLSDIEILKDVDYGDLLRCVAPEQASELLSTAGVEWDEVKGTVRSITYRAHKGLPR